MSLCGYRQRMSPGLHVNMEMECPHVSMRIMTQGVFMLPCGYGHALSPCFYVYMDMEWLHVSIWI